MKQNTGISVFLWAAIAVSTTCLENARAESSTQASAQGSLPTYVCRKATGEIRVDGRLEEADWNRSREIQLLDNSAKGSPMQPETTAKMLWDDEYLYISFIAEDGDIHATMKNRDEHLWTEEVVEVFVGKADMYIEIEVNPLNALFDGVIDIRGQTGRPQFDVEEIAKVNFDIKHETVVEGTMKNRKDQDQRWVVELAIPHTALKDIHSVPPKNGDVWRINLYRIDRSLEAGKVKGAAGAWSPTGGWFHNPERFGRIVFESQK